MAFAFYLQTTKGLAPCPMCQLQRIFLGAMGVIFLIGGIHNPKGKGRYAYCLIIILLAVFGATIAGRQVWLQYHPPVGDVACGPSLGYLFQVLSFFEAISKVFVGTGDCAKIEWQFLGLTLPGWSFLAFVALAAGSVLPLLRRKS